LSGRSIAHAEGGERIIVNEGQWNVINTQRKHKMLMEKECGKKEENGNWGEVCLFFIRIFHYIIYNTYTYYSGKMEAQKQILFHHELRIVNCSGLHENRVTNRRNCVQRNDPRPSIKNTSLLFNPPPTQFQNAHCRISDICAPYPDVTPSKYFKILTRLLCGTL